MDAGLNATRVKMLGELAEMALVLARDLQQAALAAETTEEKARLADAFHRVGRGLRQSLALDAKLERDAETDARAAQAPADAAPEDTKVRRQGRAARLQAEIERLIWTERERLEAEPMVLRVRLERLLANEARAEDFLETPAEIQIARLCQTLGIPPAHSRAGGNPSRASASSDCDPPSSAWSPASAGTSGDGDRRFDPSG